MEVQLANLWEETAVAPPVCPPLDRNVSTDVLVIGAGYLGLSAALHLAEAGVETVVVDAEAPGWGASGRNGGQIIPGLKYDPAELESMFGHERGKRLWQFAGRTADVVFDLIDRHKLNCGARRSAWIQGVHSHAAAERSKRRAADWQSRGAAVEYLDQSRAAKISGTSIYVGAFADYRAGALQPLSFARELARAALAAGARIHGKTRIITLERDGAGWRALCQNGKKLSARRVILATNAYSDKLVPGVSQSIVAANSLQIATAPLPPSVRSTILPNGEVLSDTRRIIRYWRLDDDGRLLMGGRGPYREPRPLSDWSHLMRDVRVLFPALCDVPFTHRWGGRVAIHTDYLPHLHRLRHGLTIAVGCQGRGIGWQTAMGAELARMQMRQDYVPVLPVSPIAPITFHHLKAMGVTATIAMYRVLDRFGFT